MLKFHPEPGTVVICDYTTGFRKPEMVKRRPVVVISPRLKRRHGLATVVPLSTTPPVPVCDHHCKISLNPVLPAPFDSAEMWVKADMLATVGFERLELLRTGRDQQGKRKYLTPQLEQAHLKTVYQCVLHAIGIGHLTWPTE
ncbi:type II toxin-antitoxin system PemK/MazF family toxin [Bradyrhizobium sp. CIR48]|uniref:type II toxin-antitoxin system PemK/MazF family toxin n=1 Tax=Bradyrhizobium sp. CIR48 TaxID=2663840 RepID=UPI0016063D39